MQTLKCKFCDYESIQKDPAVCKRVMGNHVRFKHPDKAGPKGYVKIADRAAPPAGEVAIKRTYNRRQSSGPEVSFCPCCGTNLHAVRVALRITK